MIGEVQIVETFGTEEDIVNISRVCTGNEDKTINDVSKNIEGLIRRQHWSVFEHASVRMEIIAPIYVMRQWMRHRNAWMEKSRRYTNDSLTFGEIVGKEAEEINDRYEAELQLGNKPEDARKDLPLDLMTKVIWTTDLRALFHFFRLRCDDHAQKEIRELAEELMVQTYKFYPSVVDAFLKYDMGSFSLGIDTLFDLFMLTKHGAYAYEGSEKRINAWGENAEKRLKLVKRLFERLDEGVRNSGEGSGESSDTSTDGKKVSETLRPEREAGAEEGDNTSMDGVRKMVTDQQTTTPPIGQEDSGNQQLFLFNSKELSVPPTEGSEGVDQAEALESTGESNIVEGHFGV